MKKNTPAEILAHVIENGGATVAIADGAQHLMGKRDGDVYMVGGALDRDGYSVPELFIPLAELTENAIEFALHYVECLAAPNHWTACGFWIEDGMVVIDATDAIMGSHLAARIGNERGERAMYGLATGELVALNASKVSVTA